MSNEEPAEEVPTSIDDPDWVDRIVARAMESAQRAAAEPAPVDSLEPAEPIEPVEPVGSLETVETAEAIRPVDEDEAAVEPGYRLPERTPTETAALTVRPAPTPAAAPRRQRPPDESTSVFDVDHSAVAVLPVEPEAPQVSGQAARTRALVEWIAVIAGAVLVALLVKTFLVQAFFIPSGSMEPTLQINDRVLVNKLSYDFSDVKRGDLVVFEKPANLVTDTDDLIKRVIGLPGETIELIDGRVFIDGRGLNEPYVGDQPTNWLGFDETARGLCGGDDICTVPEGFVFVMGDNRAGSTDSRRFGPIDESDIVGRAFLRIWPLNDIGWL